MEVLPVWLISELVPVHRVLLRFDLEGPKRRVVDWRDQSGSMPKEDRWGLREGRALLMLPLGRLGMPLQWPMVVPSL